MKKTIILTLIAMIIAMAGVTSCSSDDDEIIATQGATSGIASLQFSSARIVMKDYNGTKFPAMELSAKNGKTEYKLQFLSKAVTRQGLVIGNDDLVDTQLMYRNGIIWTSLIVGIGYPYENDEGTISIGKIGSQYKIHIEIPQLNDAGGNIVAKSLIYDVITSVDM